MLRIVNDKNPSKYFAPLLDFEEATHHKCLLEAYYVSHKSRGHAESSS